MIGYYRCKTKFAQSAFDYLWVDVDDEHAKELPFVVLFNENAGTAFAGEVEG